MKKITLLFCLCIIFMFCACQNKKESNQVLTAEQAEDTTEFKAVEDGMQETTVKIFYGDDNAENIISTEVVLEKLTTSAIMKELAERNIVSEDTKLLSLMYGENEGQKVLKLDLSKEFKEYASTMGSSGEYILVGSLVNTFLTAYDAEKILITIEGEVFETPHQLYENYLMFYQPQ